MLSRLYLLAIFTFVFAPIVTSMVFSFNSDRFPTVPLGHFTLHWYETAFSRPEVWTAFRNSAVVALAESLRKDVREHGIGVSVLCPMRVTSNIDFSARNRPDALGGPTANRTYTQEELDGLDGRMLDVEPVAELVVDAMRENRLYIHTHREAETYFGRRADRIREAFERAL